MNAVQVTLSRSISVRSLLISGGALLIQPAEGPITVDSAFVIAYGNGSSLVVTGTDWKKTVTFYLRRNPDAYQDIPAGQEEDQMLSGGRVLAGET